MPRTMLEELQAAAHRESLRVRKQLTWQSLVRTMIEDKLLPSMQTR